MTPQPLSDFTLEAQYRESILAGKYEKLGKIELKGNDVLEWKNRTLVIEGDILLKDNAKLIVENSRLLWNNKHFAEYIGRIEDNAVLDMRGSILVRGNPSPVNVYVTGGTVTMRNSTSYLYVSSFGGSTLIEASPGLAADTVFWIGHQPNRVVIRNSRVANISLNFHRGEPETLYLSGLKWGGPQSVTINTTEGASLQLESSWVGRPGEPFWKGGWVLGEIDEGETIEGWQVGTLPPENAKIAVWPNKKHYVVRDSELDGVWMKFRRDSVVKLSNWRGGHLSYWNLRKNAEVEGVGYDVTLENTSVDYFKLLPLGRLELDNVKDVQVSPWANASVLVNNSVISRNLNLRGNETVKITNSSIPSGILFLDARRLASFGGHIHSLELQNTTISGNMQIASTYTRIKGGLTILFRQEEVDFVWGTVEREYPVEVRDARGNPVANAKLELLDPQNQIVWNGTTSQQGSALLALLFTPENWEGKWQLRATTPQGSLETEVGFLSSTPIVLRPATPVSVDGDGSDWAGASPLAVDPLGDAPSEVYDLKALSARRTNEQLYLMIEFATTKPQAEVHIFLNQIYFIAARFAPGAATTDLLSWPEQKDLGDIPLAYGKVLELAIPLQLIGTPERVQVNIVCKDENMNDMDRIGNVRF